MKLLWTATVLALALAVPSIAQAATDGTLGGTSTGTFTASATASAPAGTQVSISGLVDFSFAPVIIDQAVANQGSYFGSQSVTKNFCIARTTNGDVDLKVSEVDISDGKSFNLNKGGTSPDFIPVISLSILETAYGANHPLSTAGQSFSIHNPPTTCNQVGVGDAYKLTMAIPTTVGTSFGGTGGNFNGQFTLLVTPL